MIEVRGLKKSIRNGARVVDILRGIDLTIPQGQFVAIMGASGSRARARCWDCWRGWIRPRRAR